MKTEKAVVGIDISKANFDVCIRRKRQEKHAVFENHNQGHRVFIKWLKKEGLNQGDICMEATGSLWQDLAERLYDEGYQVFVVNPFRIKKFREHQLHTNKTDMEDARLIARFCQKEAEDLIPWRPMSEENKQLQTMVRRLEELKQMKQNEELRLKDGIKTMIVCQDLKEHIAWLNQRIKNLETEIDEHIARCPKITKNMRLLITIPGIGKTTAIIILAEVAYIGEFSKASHFAAYCGLNPSRNTSGTSVRKRSKVSKQGRSGLRKCFYMPALVALKHNPMVIDLDKRMTASGHVRMEVVVAAMKKLAHQVYGVLKNQTPFDPDFAAKYEISS